MGTQVWFIPVLTSWGTVEVDDNLQTVCPCPTDGIKEVSLLPLNVRLARANIKGPIPDRDAHVVESKISTTWLGSNDAAHHNASILTQLLQLPQSHSR